MTTTFNETNPSTNLTLNLIPVLQLNRTLTTHSASVSPATASPFNASSDTIPTLTTSIQRIAAPTLPIPASAPAAPASASAAPASASAAPALASAASYSNNELLFETIDSKLVLGSIIASITLIIAMVTACIWRLRVQRQFARQKSIPFVGCKLSSNTLSSPVKLKSILKQQSSYGDNTSYKDPPSILQPNASISSSYLGIWNARNSAAIVDRENFLANNQEEYLMDSIHGNTSRIRRASIPSTIQNASSLTSNLSNISELDYSETFEELNDACNVESDDARNVESTNTAPWKSKFQSIVRRPSKIAAELLERLHERLSVYTICEIPAGGADADSYAIEKHE